MVSAAKVLSIYAVDMGNGEGEVIGRGGDGGCEIVVIGPGGGTLWILVIGSRTRQIVAPQGSQK